MKKLIILLLFGFYAQNILAQLTTEKSTFTRRDSLQGGFSKERMCYDVLRYDLNITINPSQKSVVGHNKISFKTLSETQTIQLDLFENMKIDSIIFNKKKLQYKRDEIAVFVNFPEKLIQNTNQELYFYYSGNPIVAKHAPWDGGFVFNTDANGKPWIGAAVQGFGASCWFPVKDSQSDEPNLGATIKVAVPNGLMNVSNGRFTGSEDLKNGYTRWDWEVKNPINNYDITVNIADYVHIKDNHKGLDLDYYVLRYNKEKARKHFEEVKPMMDCFQTKFGEYPFQTDGFKLVETPYLGMEHQSAVAYGNRYMKGYMGQDLSGTGVGLLFDYITIHESGHEWFGNSITSKDIADMWIHEGFTQYTEIVFVECQFGYEKAMIYANGLKNGISNEKPIIGFYKVNKEGSGDMYPKGAIILNTLRHLVDNDEKWWKIILKYCETFKHKIVETKNVEEFFIKETGLKLQPFFNQYLREAKVPKLELKTSKNGYEYKFSNCNKTFEMPLDVLVNGVKTRITATANWKKNILKVNKTPVVTVDTQKIYINN